MYDAAYAVVVSYYRKCLRFIVIEIKITEYINALLNTPHRGLYNYLISALNFI